MEEILHHFKSLRLQPRAPNLILFEDTGICASDGNPAPPVNMPFNTELGGTGVQVMH